MKNLVKTFLSIIHPSKQNREQNIIHIDDPNLIHSTASLKNVKLIGNISIGEGVKIIKGVNLAGHSRINISRYTSLNGPNTDLIARINEINIGSFCSIARSVSIQEYNHIYNRMSTYFIFHNIFDESIQNDITSKGPINIGNDVWIGAQSVIVSGVTIGNGAVIAANSVVTNNIPPYAIAAGSPAKVVKYRFEKEIIEYLQKIRWWDWPIKKIKQNKHLFIGDLTMQKLEQIN